MNLKCPNCKSLLIKKEQQYVCNNNHSFDIAKEGYVNLLIGKTNSGDNKEMVQARYDFLNKDYYKRLSDTINNNFSHLLVNKRLLDCGCGEGYFTSLLLENKPATLTGLDISKYAIQKAAKRNRNIKYIVSSGINLPLFDGDIDIIINIFAPFFPNEFSRVLERCGMVIKVIPGHNHLIELKELLYASPYQNEEKISYEKFNLLKKIHLEYQSAIDSEDIANLFKMTPYYYKTKPEDRLRLEVQKTLIITFSFVILLFQRT